MPIRTSRQRRRRPEQIEKILADFETSSLTQAAFASQKGISVSTLQFWRRKKRSGRLEELLPDAWKREREAAGQSVSHRDSPVDHRERKALVLNS